MRVCVRTLTCQCCVAGKPGEPPTEEERRQQAAYEEWMMQYTQYISLNVKAGEDKVAKFRKTKKSLNAKNRQVRIANRKAVRCFDTFSCSVG